MPCSLAMAYAGLAVGVEDTFGNSSLRSPSLISHDHLCHFFHATDLGCGSPAGPGMSASPNISIHIQPVILARGLQAVVQLPPHVANNKSLKALKPGSCKS